MVFQTTCFGRNCSVGFVVVVVAVAFPWMWNLSRTETCSHFLSFCVRVLGRVL